MILEDREDEGKTGKDGIEGLISWDPELPTSVLPQKVLFSMREEAERLLNDMRANPHRVVLIPAPERMHPTHMIRAIESVRPTWFSRMYHDRLEREGNTIVCTRVEESLRHIIEGTDRPYIRGVDRRNHIYDKYMRETAWDSLITGYCEEGYEIPPNKHAISFERQGRPIGPWRPEWPVRLLPPLIGERFKRHAGILGDAMTRREKTRLPCSPLESEGVDWYCEFIRDESIMTNNKNYGLRHTYRSLTRIMLEQDRFDAGAFVSDRTDTYYRKVIAEHLSNGYSIEGKRYAGDPSVAAQLGGLMLNEASEKGT